MTQILQMTADFKRSVSSACLTESHGETKLPEGSYTLKVVTRFTNGKLLLNTPRLIVYE